MSDKQFSVGDVVQLASGGPKMTVCGEGTTKGCVYCKWFTKDEAVTGHEFNPGALVSVGPKKG
jgi:uncharacterized protein YodC (DUF2158 family)